MPVNNLIITNAGAAALVNAAANGTNSVTIASCGLSTAHNIYTAASNALIGQFKTINNISGGAIDPATIHLAFADQSNDAYDLRAIALYLTDGTLFAIYSQANPIITKVAGVDGILSVNIKLLNNNSSQILFGNTNIFNPPSTENSIGVIEIATQTETNTGTDDLRAITPKKLTAFWNSKSAWTVNNDGAGSGLDADLLDGQHGAFYLDLANATNTLPSARLNGLYNISISGNAASADNATNATNATKLGNILAANYWHAGNDGAGSGLDADLFDGLDSSAFAKKSGATFTGSITVPNITFSNVELSEKTLNFSETSGRSTFLFANQTSFGIWDTSLGGVFNLNKSTGIVNMPSSVFLGGNQAWHAGNDGAGSGLDADTLDGLDSSAFAKLSGANFTGNVGVYGALEIDGGDLYLKRTTHPWGYIIRPNQAGFKNLQFATQGGSALDNIELNSVNVNVCGNQVWHAGNDGAGSGLDADLLDGYQATNFLINDSATFIFRSSIANGYMRFCQGNPTRSGYIEFFNAASVRSGYIGYSDGTNFNVTTDGLVLALGATNFLANGNQIWHAGNDGAGSGLDADLLDGQHGAYYWSDGRASKSLATSGYRILPDGTIEQWGEATLTGDTNQVVSFPIAFPNACLQAVGCQGGDFAVNTDAGAGVQSFTNSTITLRNGSWMTTKIRYFAIGN